MKIKLTTIQRAATYGICDVGKYRYLLDTAENGRPIIKRHPIKSIGFISRRPYWEIVARFDGTVWHVVE